MPSGYRLLRLETVDSTNAEARRRAKAGEPGPLWICSARQSQGRGRGGREWISQHGNLFASLLVGINCPIRVAGQLALVAGVIAFDTIAKLIAYEGRSELLLKWPNDILLAGEKLAGDADGAVDSDQQAGEQIAVMGDPFAAAAATPLRLPGRPDPQRTRLAGFGAASRLGIGRVDRLHPHQAVTGGHFGRWRRKIAHLEQ